MHARRICAAVECGKLFARDHPILYYRILLQYITTDKLGIPRIESASKGFLI